MTTRILITTGLCACLLTGCGPSPQANSEQDGKKVEMKLNIPQHQLEALNKAKGVEQTLQDADERRRDALRE